MPCSIPAQMKADLKPWAPVAPMSLCADNNTRPAADHLTALTAATDCNVNSDREAFSDSTGPTACLCSQGCPIRRGPEEQCHTLTHPSKPCEPALTDRLRCCSKYNTELQRL